MATRITARCVPRSDNSFPISVDVSGAGNIYLWYLAVGDVAGGPPATYGDFPTPLNYGWPNMTNVQLKIEPGGSSLSITGLVDTTGSPGDDMYLALFRGPSSSPTDIPFACAGPFVIDAS